ncbi:8152_t:CDS:2, partial [Entrophospora sp. SA101]
MSHTPRELRTPTPYDFSSNQSDDDSEIDELTPLTSTRNDTKSNFSWATFRTRLRYYVPVFSWMPSYSLNTFWGDFFASLTVTAILLPSGLSFSVLAKLPPVHGLYSIVIPGVIYSFLGTSRQLVIGPEALVAMLVGSSVAQQQQYLDKEDDASVAIMIASLITFFVGILTFILGIVRLGFIDSVLSRALLRGFISAVAIVIIIEQCLVMLRLTDLNHHVGRELGHASSTLDKFIYIVNNIEQSHIPTAIISFSSLLFLLISGSIKGYLSKRFSW